MNDKPHSEKKNTTEFSFLGRPRRVITRERDGQYSDSGKLELGDLSVIWDRTFDESGRPLEWKFFEDSALESVLEYRYESGECVVTERDAHGRVIETTKQEPFSVLVQGSECRVPSPSPLAVMGMVANLKHEFDFDSKGNWIKCTTTTTVSSAKLVHVEEREIVYW